MSIFVKWLVGFFLLIPFAHADDHGSSSNTGAFTTFFVSAIDHEAYINEMKANQDLFKSMGTSAAGFCRTMTGQDFRGQMFVWNAYEDVSSALVASSSYDPEKAPSEFAKLREPKYSAAWKPIKPFGIGLNPGYERVQRLKISPSNMEAFIVALSKFEKAIRSAGHESFQNALFVPLGGGTNEVGTYMLRSITSDAEAHGKIFDDYFAGASWAPAYFEVAGLIDEIVSDNFEQCGMIYSAE